MPQAERGGQRNEDRTDFIRSGIESLPGLRASTGEGRKSDHGVKKQAALKCRRNAEPQKDGHQVSCLCSFFLPRETQAFPEGISAGWMHRTQRISSSNSAIFSTRRVRLWTEAPSIGSPQKERKEALSRLSDEGSAESNVRTFIVQEVRQHQSIPALRRVDTGKATGVWLETWPGDSSMIPKKSAPVPVHFVDEINTGKRTL